MHGIPSSIMSNRDLRFMSRFWQSLQEVLGTKPKLSSTYHPHTNGQTKRTIQSLKDLLRACVLEQECAWDNYLLLIEFTYNNNFHLSIGMALFEELYDRRCKTPLCWYESSKSAVIGHEILQQTFENIKMIKRR